WVAAEYADSHQVVCRSSRLHRIACPVHRRVIRDGIAVLDAGIKPKQPFPGLRSQHRPRELFLCDVTLPFEKEKEKRLVLENGPADAAAKLVPVSVVLPRAIEIVQPRIRIQSRVAVGPEHAALQLVCSCSSRHLNLAGATAQLRICRGDNDSDLFN